MATAMYVMSKYSIHLLFFAVVPYLVLLAVTHKAPAIQVPYEEVSTVVVKQIAFKLCMTFLQTKPLHALCHQR